MKLFLLLGNTGYKFSKSRTLFQQEKPFRAKPERKRSIRVNVCIPYPLKKDKIQPTEWLSVVGFVSFA